MLDSRFLQEHISATRRHFLMLGATGIAALRSSPLFGDDDGRAAPLKTAIANMEPWLTPSEDFRDVSRGKPKPHALPEAKRKEVGLTRDTWKLQVVSDANNPATLQTPLSTKAGNALDFARLMELAKNRTVRFAKVMTCLNIGCPLGMGVWEGIPMRDVVWMTQPKENLRRVFYYGYHNDDDKQMFRSSLPIGRVLEDTDGLPPVILCFKLNGEWLSPERGGPVRVVVPEAYGFKSIKWLTHLILSNRSNANDTYAEKNNDVDSNLKTFSATLSIPDKIAAGNPIPITGWAQSGISGLKKVQVWIQKRSDEWTAEDPLYLKAPWQDAQILPIQDNWRDGFTAPNTLRDTHSFDNALRPRTWPMRLSKAHWAFLHPGLPPGEYIMRCRTIDQQGAAQPMPRPFRKSGHAKIETRKIVIT